MTGQVRNSKKFGSQVNNLTFIFTTIRCSMVILKDYFRASD